MWLSTAELSQVSDAARSSRRPVPAAASVKGFDEDSVASLSTTQDETQGAENGVAHHSLHPFMGGGGAGVGGGGGGGGGYMLAASYWPKVRSCSQSVCHTNGKEKNYNLALLLPPAGSRHHQPSGQHLPGGVEGQVARDTSGVRAWRRRGLLLHHQAAGQRQQPVRGPLGVTTGVKGDQACCRKQGILSETQQRMLISPYSTSRPLPAPALCFALIVGACLFLLFLGIDHWFWLLGIWRDSSNGNGRSFFFYFIFSPIST